MKENLIAGFIRAANVQQEHLHTNLFPPGHFPPLLHRVLIIIEIAVVRMLGAVLWHQRRGTDAICEQVLAEVEYSLRQLRNPLLASLGVLVARPDELGQGRGARPHLAADDRVVYLFGPEGRCDADDVLLLFRGKVGGEVVVINPLPRLVRSAPGTTRSTVVEVGRFRVRVGLVVVTRIVGHIATKAAVEVEEVCARHDRVVAHVRKVVNVLETSVPGLHDNILGDFQCGSIW